MPQSTNWWRSWLASLVLVSGLALAECSRSADVVAEGVADTEPKALSLALSEAIASERGVFLSVRQKLLEYASFVIEDGQTRARTESSFEEEIYTQYAGFITRYQVLERSKKEEGARVQVRAWVCLDPVVALFGDRDVLAPIVSRLPKEWKATILVKRPVLPEEFLASALKTGATYVGILDLERSRLRSGDLITYQLEGRLVLYDLRTLAVSSGISHVAQGTGFSESQALAQAAERLAQEIARQLIAQFSKESYQVTFVVQNLRRGGSRFTLMDALMAIPGVIRVDSHSYNEADRQAIIVASLDAQSDPCAIAQQLTQQRRILLQLGTCERGRVFLNVIRE